MEILKPCPFCGGEAMLTARDDGSGGIWGTKCGFTPHNHGHYGGCKG